MVNTLALRRFASLGSRGMASIGDQAAAAAAGFVVSVYIGRRIGVDALGIYAISNALVLLVRALQSAVVLEPMAVLGPRKAGEYDNYFGFLVGLQVLTVLLFSLLFAGVLAFAHVYDYLNTQAFFVMLASCLYVNFLCFQLFLCRQFYVDHRQYMAALQSVSFLALVVAGLAAFWQVDGLTVVDVYTLLTICSVAVCLVQGGRFWSRVGRPSAAEVRQNVNDHWAFGKWVLLAVPFGTLSQQGFFPFVGFAVSEEAAGLLKAAEALVAPFVQVVIGMQLMLVPMTSRNVDSMPLADQKRLAVNISLAFLAVAVAYSALLYLAGEYAIVLLFGETMRDAVPVLAILSLFPLFRGFPMAAAVILSARKRANLLFLTQAGSTILTLLICVPLVLRWGVLGGAAGLVVSQASHAILMWGCLLWLWREDRRLAAAG